MKITKIQWVWIVLGGMILLGMCSNNAQSSPGKSAATRTVVATETKTVEVQPTKTVVVEPTETVVVEPTKMVPTAMPTIIATKIVVEDKSAAPCKTGQIKGSQNGIYHVPGGRDYKRTKKNVTCFDTIDDAKAAGFVPTANPQEDKMVTCQGCGVPGAPICQECADEANENALNGTKQSGIETRRMQEWSEQDDAALERQQLAAGWERSSMVYHNDELFGYFEEPDEYEE